MVLQSPRPMSEISGIVKGGKRGSGVPSTNQRLTMCKKGPVVVGRLGVENLVNDLLDTKPALHYTHIYISLPT